jgi:hypothetical protein
MPGIFRRRAERSAPRALAPTLAIAGFGAVIAVAAAVPAAAIASAPHHAAAVHHSSAKHHHRSKHLMVKGIVAGHHGRTVTVFAKTATVGSTIRHNERIRVRFARSAHGRTKIRTGNHLRLVATGVAHKRTFVIRHNDDETVTASPATLIFGTVETVNGNVLTISENDRDNGDHHDGDDNDGDGGGDNDGVSPNEHSPGGPGDGDNDGHGHQVMIDDTSATILVDGAAGTIAVGDTVAVLGETMDNTITASSVWAFSTPQAFMRGNIQTVSGDSVTLKDDGNTSTVSLTGVPLALNGDVGATTSQLMAGDKLLLIGTVDATSGDFTPELAFAFNHRDDNPCGDNDEHHGDGGGGDGGSDG